MPITFILFLFNNLLKLIRSTFLKSQFDQILLGASSIFFTPRSINILINSISFLYSSFLIAIEDIVIFEIINFSLLSNFV